MKTKVVAKSVLVNDEGKLLALRRSADDLHRPSQWDLPGGAADEGEDFTEAAAREIKEEIGLDVSSGELQLVYSDTQIKDQENLIRMFYVARVKGNQRITLSHEHDHYEWMSWDYALKHYDYPRHRELIKYIYDNNLLSDTAQTLA